MNWYSKRGYLHWRLSTHFLWSISNDMRGFYIHVCVIHHTKVLRFVFFTKRGGEGGGGGGILCSFALTT